MTATEQLEPTRETIQPEGIPHEGPRESVSEGAPREAAPRERERRPGRGKYIHRRKVCAFCVDKVEFIDYKEPNKLRRYISDRGKIEPRRKTGTCARHQRALASALKRARHIALLPFTGAHVRETGGVGLRG